MVPYFSDPNEQDDEQQNQDAGFQVAGAPQTAGQGAAPAQAGAKPKAEKTGSGFTNIDKYVQANKAQNFGSEVVGKVQGDVNKAQDSMQQAAGSFGQKVNANQAFGKAQVDQALNDPSKANAAQFQAGLDQQYKGPKSLAESQDDYNKFTGDTSKAQTAANQLSSESGRFGLLDNYFGRQNYGFGQKSLDNALFQAQPGVGAQSNAVQQQAQGLQSQGKQMQDQLQSQASQRAGEIEQARNYQRGQLGFDQSGQVVSGQGAYGGLQKDLATGLTDANAKRTANQQALQQAISGGNEQGYDLTPEQMQQLGIDPGMSTYGINPMDYIKNGSALSMDQVATDQQRARLAALNGLVGQGYSQNMLGDKQDAGSDYSFDKERFANDTAAQQRSLEQKRQEANALVNDKAGSVQAYNSQGYNPYSGISRDQYEQQKRAINEEQGRREQAERAAIAQLASAQGSRFY